MTRPDPVHNREPNDCALCATEYAAKCCGVVVDREQLKAAGHYTPDGGTSPYVTNNLIKFGCEVITARAAMPIVRLTDTTSGPDWNDPSSFEAVRQMYRLMLPLGFVGVTQTQVQTPWDHAVVVEDIDDADTITVVCSLRGLYTVSLREFVLGHQHKHGIEVRWVRRNQGN